ncbi:MAG: DUF4286 family protein [Cyclobacteriaceae bacterium]|nr:DUF4286 family protein [Cyclobacteriaceae bacterium]MDW8330562.1 DUF4286 family protein [Cyclobacteriaceae bacterium]
MYVYNVTVGIDRENEAEWVAWMKSEHMPRVLATGMFSSARLFKILHESEDGTLSYSVQYVAESLDRVSEYLERFAPALIEEHRQRFANHVAFRTVLEEV